VLGLLLSLPLIVPAAAGATILPPWGSNLQATPNYDTANGYYNSSTSSYNGNPTPGASNAISPQYHSGDDLAVWNTNSAFTAPQGGQVLEVKVKGCAWKDTTAPTDSSGEQYSAGVPVNQVNFQALTRQSDGSYVEDGPTAAGFLMPFCSNPSSPTTGTVNTSTVTTFQPLHLCINTGDTVDFYDIGGNIPNSGGPSWYPNGVPFFVIGGYNLANGLTMNSFAHAENSPSDFTGSNLQSEPNEELQLQVIEGVGDDAYGLCPGGAANEPSSSNQVICVYHSTNPGDPYGTCNAQGQPVYAPVNTAPPSISGTAAPGQRLDEVHGTWTNSPYGYKYQWELCGSSGGSCSAISGQTNDYYYPTSGDVGHTIRVQEWASNDANTEGPATSAPTGVVGGSSSSGSTGGSSGTGSGSLKLTKLKLNPATFYAAKGSTITYNLNHSGKVVFRVISLKTHRVVKVFSHTSHPGGNAAKLRGLKAGRYELVVVAGGRNTTKTFTVKPSHPKKKHATLHLAAADLLSF